LVVTAQLDRGRLTAWTVLILGLATLGYASRAAGGKPDQDILYKYSSAIGGLIQYAIILAIALAITGSRRELLALRPPTSWPRGVGLGLLALVATYAVAGIVSAYSDPEGEQGLTPKHWEPSHAGAYAANFVVIAIVAPFVEELTFRGLGYSLLQPLGQTTAILWVGVAFGVYHGLLEALPILIVFGMGLALIRARTESVYPGMFVHAVFNSITLALVLSR
jgi:membrane protease YdiL (CAAX protease family)